MSRNNKLKRTKKQKKMRRLRRIKKKFGVEELFFYEELHKAYAYSFSRYSQRGYKGKSIATVEKLKKYLSSGFAVLDLDNDEIYNSIDHYREEHLILVLSGIKRWPKDDK